MLRFHAENGLLQNQVSVGTLGFFWNAWKENVMKIFDYLGHLEIDEVYGQFCLNYLDVSVINHCENNKTVYLLRNADAYWDKHICDHNLQRKGRLVSCKPKQFAHAAQCYWSSTMLSVGRTVLEKLKAVHEFSQENSLPSNAKLSHLFICMVLQSLL